MFRADEGRDKKMPILERALEIVSEANKEGLNLRLLGGLGVKSHSQKTMVKAPFLRDYDDMDFAISTSQNRLLPAFFRKLGISENKRFNSLNGHQRMIFFDGPEDEGTKIDIFVGVFQMCHKIDFNSRLTADDMTIPLAELFLTKLQIVEINNKDITDVLAMVLEHNTGSSDLDTINTDRLGKLCSVDWGLHHTIEKNIGKIIGRLEEYSLTDDENKRVKIKMESILQAMNEHQKSLKWKARALVGESVKWYEEPEDAVREAVNINKK